MKHNTSTLLLPLLAASQLAFASPATASEAIVRKANCFMCHSVNNQRIGPAYKDVAARYRGDDTASARLFNKVRQGGAGNWGDTPMTPHPVDTIGNEELTAAIQWILSRQ